MEQERIRPRSTGRSARGRYVLYWMQASQRASWNHALQYAVDEADRKGRPVLVLFCLIPDYPEANLRHYAFMLEGLAETGRDLADRGAGFVVEVGSPPEVVASYGARAALVVTDCGYLHHQRLWRRQVAERLERPFVEVETDVVVPVEAAYPKQAVSAAVLRRRIRPALDRFLTPMEEKAPRVRFSGGDFPSSVPLDVEGLLGRLVVDRSVPTVPLGSGNRAARQALQRFLDERLERYAEERNDPGRDVCSGLSPYLHFGQLSPLEAAWEASRRGGAGAEAFLEERVVRRELAVNAVYYNPAYDAWEGLPAWARDTLSRHARDPRPALYSREELEAARTEDPAWNAAQRELVHFGKIHGYMRMYWGRQLLLWTRNPREAFRVGLYLNNKYALDGRDPSSYVGVAWCLGLHDRPFKERPIFGQVRSMTPQGLRRKLDLTVYLEKTSHLPSRA